MIKDLNITAEWLNKNGSVSLITDLLTQIGKIAMSEIGEDVDVSESVKVFERWNKIEISE